MIKYCLTFCLSITALISLPGQSPHSPWRMMVSPLALHPFTPTQSFAMGIGGSYVLDTLGKTLMELQGQFYYTEEYPLESAEVAAGKGIISLEFSRQLLAVQKHNFGMRGGLGYFRNLWEKGDWQYSPPLQAGYKRPSSFFDEGVYMSLGIYWQKDKSPWQLSLSVNSLPLMAVTLAYAF